MTDARARDARIAVASWRRLVMRLLALVMIVALALPNAVAFAGEMARTNVADVLVSNSDNPMPDDPTDAGRIHHCAYCACHHIAQLGADVPAIAWADQEVQFASSEAAPHARTVPPPARPPRA